MKKLIPQQQQQSTEFSYFPEQQQKTWGAVAVGVVGAGVSAYEGSQNRKAAKDAAPKPVDINGAVDLAHQTAINNARDSQILEQQLTPWVSNLKQQSVTDLVNNLSPDQYSQLAGAILNKQGTSAAPNYSFSSPLLDQAAAAQSAQLAKGTFTPYAQLPTEVSNIATRKALANAGGVAPGTLSLGRDLTARDLGLTSLQLGQQQQQDYNARIAAALQGGQVQAQTGLAQAQLGAQQSQFNRTNALNTAQALQALSQGNFARYLSASQFGQSIAAPTVGLDPGSVAGLYTGNQNIANSAAQQQAAARISQNNSYGQALGQLAGAAAGAYNSYNANSNPNTIPGDNFSLKSIDRPASNPFG